MLAGKPKSSPLVAQFGVKYLDFLFYRYFGSKRDIVPNTENGKLELDLISQSLLL